MHMLMGVTMLLQGSGQGVLAAAPLTWDTKQMLASRGSSMDQDDGMGLIGTALAPQLSEGRLPCLQSRGCIGAVLLPQVCRKVGAPTSSLFSETDTFCLAGMLLAQPSNPPEASLWATPTPEGHLMHPIVAQCCNMANHIRTAECAALPSRSAEFTPG